MKTILYKQPSTVQANIITEPLFVGSIVRNQPNKPQYEVQPWPKTWFMQEWLKAIVGGVGYINLANQYGYGFHHKPVDYGTVPKIIDRSSPLMWV